MGNIADAKPDTTGSNFPVHSDSSLGQNLEKCGRNTNKMMAFKERYLNEVKTSSRVGSAGRKRAAGVNPTGQGVCRTAGSGPIARLTSGYPVGEGKGQSLKGAALLVYCSSQKLLKACLGGAEGKWFLPAI